MLLKKKTDIFVFILLFILLPGQGYSQDVLTLQDIVNQTLEENYQIRIIKNQQLAAENENTFGNAGFLPSVDASASQSWSVQNSELSFFNGEGRTGENAQSTSLNAMLEANWTVFDGFRMFAAKEQFESLERLSDVQTRFFIEQTVTDITHLYNELISSEELLVVYGKSFEISRFRLNLEREKREIGAGNALMYHQALTDYNADSILMVRQRAMITDIKMQINRILNNEPTADWTTGTTLDSEHLSASSLNELVDKVLENNLEIEISRIEEVLAETNVRMEKSMRYPQVDLFGRYSFNRQTSEVGFVEESQNYGFQYGITVRMNLFSGNQQNIRIRNALLEQENTELSRLDTDQLLRSQTARFINQYQSYLQEYDLMRENLETARKSLEIAREQLSLGAINGFEFRQNQLTVFQIENQIIQLKLSIKALETDIRRLSGDIVQWVLEN